jgi:hypothetical protein
MPGLYFPGVDENTLEWLDILGRGLMFGAAAVLVLSIIGALGIGSSSSSLPLIGELQQENRGTIAIGALGAGLTAAGVLAGLGAIIRLLVAERRESHKGE